jgi:hypothetical protein
MTTEASDTMIGTRHVCQCCARRLTIVDVYAGTPGDPDDAPGYDYVFDGEPGVRWISTNGAAVRFRKLEKETK